MSDPAVISIIANRLRPVSSDVSKGKGKLCLSTVYLNKLNKAFDENAPDELPSSFHLTDSKASLQNDLKFLLDLIRGSKALKITPDLQQDEDSTIVNLRRFDNISVLEIHKTDVKNVIGLQKLRGSIEEITCKASIDNLEDLLDRCGGDFSQRNTWSELRKLFLSYNQIQTIDASFDSVPWLNVLDLSHNDIKELDCIDSLSNLKHLNLAYNKLEVVPRFKGQICRSLQVLLLNNNFIEDISSLSTLLTLQQLDLSQNCLLNHESLLSVSPMPSLGCLDLRGNPINCHLSHRSLTSNYLNKNTASLNFILDGVPLKKNEKSLAGSQYLLSAQGSLGLNSNSASQSSLDKPPTVKIRKARNVKIQEGYKIESEEDRKKNLVVTPSTRSENKSPLEIKNQIEQLRKEFGNDWLSNKTGGVMQEWLNLPGKASSPINNQSPLSNYGFDITSSTVNEPSFTSATDMNRNGDTSNDTYVTCPVTIEDRADGTNKNEQVESENEEEDEIFKPTEIIEDPPSDPEHEDDIFLGGTALNEYDLMIVVGETHLSERDQMNRVIERWHMSSIKSCQAGSEPNQVDLEFDILRTDRQSRKYYLENSEEFIARIHECIVKYQVPEERVTYECIKCNHVFSKVKSKSVVEKDRRECPQCGSINMVVTKLS